VQIVSGIAPGDSVIASGRADGAARRAGRGGGAMSGLTSVSIRRPVLATVMSLVIIIFGVIGFTFLGVREYPSVDPPIITVGTSYAGASADVIESRVTEPLEASVNSVEGIKKLTSTSREGRSTIIVEFELGVDMERAANDVRDKVSQAIGRLPVDADPPQVSKADADNTPLVFLASQRPAQPAGPLGPGEQRLPRAPADHPRRQPGAGLGRAPLRHAALAGPAAARRLPTHPARRADRAARAERRAALRPHRGRDDGADRPHHGAAQHARRFRAPDPAAGRLQHRPLRRRRARRCSAPPTSAAS
jgi:hypothetical protein